MAFFRDSISRGVGNKYMEETKEIETKKEEIILGELTAKQEIFCRNFTTSKEFFGNGVQSYIDAYNIDISKPGAYDVAKSGAAENLSKPYIIERINQLLDLAGFNDENVDKQLNFLINQNLDYKSKIAAIKEYNALKKRVATKLELPEGGININIIQANKNEK